MSMGEQGSMIVNGKKVDGRTLSFGDEGVKVGNGEEEKIVVPNEFDFAEEAEFLKEQLSVHLEQVKKEQDLCFPLTASFGAVVMHPGENYSLEEYLRKADEAMYVMKQQAHARD